MTGERKWEGVVKGTAMAQLVKLFEFVLAACWMLVVSRGLRPEAYGQYVFFSTWVGIGGLLSSFGFGVTVLKFIPPLREKDPSSINPILRSLLSRRLAVLGVMAIGFWIGARWVEEVFHQSGLQSFRGLTSMWLVTFGVVSLMTAFFTALLDMRTILRATAVTQLLSLGAVGIGYVSGRLTLALVLWVSFATVGASAGWYLWKARAYFKRTASIVEMGPLYQFGRSAWGVTLLTVAAGSSLDVLLLGAMGSGSLQIGYYGVAMLLLTKVPSLFHTGGGTITLPIFSKAADTHWEEVGKAWRSYLKLVWWTIIPGMAFLGWHGSSLIHVLFGFSYEPSGKVFFVGLMAQGLALVIPPEISMNVLYAIGKERLVLGLRGVALGLHLLVSCWLIPTHGAVGAVIGWGMATSLVAIWQYVVVQKWIKGGYPWGHSVRMTVVIGLALAASSMGEMQSWKSIVGAAAVYISAMGMCGVLFKPLNHEDQQWLSQYAPALATWTRWWGPSRT